MIHIKDMNLRPLIASSKGLHLSSYIANPGTLMGLKQGLNEAIEQAENYLAPVLNEKAMKKFLEPLYKLSRNGYLLKSFRGNIAVFRTQNSFRVLNVPVDVESLCVVATTFHVKPLLKWLQSDRDFLLIGIEKNMANLYRGSMGGLRHIDSVVFPIETQSDFIDDDSYESLKQKRRRNEKLIETWDWINDWLDQMPKSQRSKLFVAGEKTMAEGLLKRIKYKPKHKKPIHFDFNQKDSAQVATLVRSQMLRETKEALDRVLLEFYWADDERLAKKNIFQVAQAAVQGQIKKLIVADGVNIFGKICNTTGSLSIHPAGLDHEDDDILDDLAQKVLLGGGEVIVAPKDKIPNQQPVLAILNKSSATKAVSKMSTDLVLLPVSRAV